MRKCGFAWPRIWAEAEDLPLLRPPSVSRDATWAIRDTRCEEGVSSFIFSWTIGTLYIFTLHPLLIPPAWCYIILYYILILFNGNHYQFDPRRRLIVQHELLDDPTAHLYKHEDSYMEDVNVSRSGKLYHLINNLSLLFIAY